MFFDVRQSIEYDVIKNIFPFCFWDVGSRSVSDTLLSKRYTLRNRIALRYIFCMLTASLIPSLINSNLQANIGWQLQWKYSTNADGNWTFAVAIHKMTLVTYMCSRKTFGIPGTCPKSGDERQWGIWEELQVSMSAECGEHQRKRDQTVDAQCYNRAYKINL